MFCTFKKVGYLFQITLILLADLTSCTCRWEDDWANKAQVGRAPPLKKKVDVGYTCTSRILNMYCSALWKQKIESYTKNLTDTPKEISQNRAGAWFWVCLYKVK